MLLSRDSDRIDGIQFILRLKNRRLQHVLDILECWRPAIESIDLVAVHKMAKMGISHRIDFHRLCRPVIGDIVIWS